MRFVDIAGGELRGAAEELFSDPETMRREGEEARSVVRREFSWDVHTDRLEEICDDVLAQGGTRKPLVRRFQLWRLRQPPHFAASVCEEHVNC